MNAKVRFAPMHVARTSVGDRISLDKSDQMVYGFRHNHFVHSALSQAAGFLIPDVFLHAKRPLHTKSVTVLIR